MEWIPWIPAYLTAVVAVINLITQWPRKGNGKHRK